VPTFHYLSPEEYDALDVEQRAAYIDAALDHLAAQTQEQRQPLQQQQQQQQPPAHDEPLAPSEGKSSPKRRDE
jgi:hypothetical protein